MSGRRHNGAAAVELAERLRIDLDSRLVQTVAAMEAKSGPLSREDQRALAASIAQRWLTELATERAEDGLPPLDPEAQASLLRDVLDSLFGAAALQPYLDDPTVREVRLNGPDTGFVVRIDGTKEPLPRLVRDQAELVYFIQALARHASTGAGGERRFDAAHPVLDMQLPGGHRLWATMDVTPWPCIVVRRHDYGDLIHLAELGARGMFPPPSRTSSPAASRLGST